MKNNVMKKGKKQIIFGTLLMVLLLNSVVHAESPEFSGAVGWHSKYVTDGRIFFEGRGMLTAEASASYKSYHLDLWHGQSDSTSENETNFIFGKSFEWDKVSADISYVYLTFGGPDVDPGAQDTHEIEVSLACNECLPLAITPEIGGFYGTEPDGYAAWFSLSRSIDVGQVNVSPYTMVQLDYDYATPEHDGLNHVEVGFNASVAIDEHSEVAFYLSHIFAGKDIRNEKLGDATVVGLTFGYSY